MYRKFFTSSNLVVIAGKNALQNDEIVKEARKQDLILHTKAKGSPFCIIKASKKPTGKIDNQSIKEAGIFCASFSKAWKQGKKIVEIHVFNKANTYKTKGMAKGTYGVKKILRRLKVKAGLAIGLKNKKLQCSPATALDKIYIKIQQGKQSKEKAAEKIQKLLDKRNIKISREKIMQLIPSGGFRI
ncbi:hypothetical protein B6U80_01925 [Candidatus Pacearchaeota archaeon ex4484_26]|nr:MAG: hypothetical protein B6U80_01925 [Candidatus Pacearchaeota archaeon ex4484_26]